MKAGEWLAGSNGAGTDVNPADAQEAAGENGGGAGAGAAVPPSAEDDYGFSAEADDTHAIPEEEGLEEADDYMYDAEAERDAEIAAETAAKNDTRQALLKARQRAFDDDPDFRKKPLTVLNAEAVTRQRAGDDIGAVAAYAKVFRKLREGNLMHPELFVTHSNRSAAYLNLGLHEEALWDANKCQELAEKTFDKQRNANTIGSYIRAFARKGYALMGLRRYRAAAAIFADGLARDPTSAEMKEGLEAAQQGVLEDLLEGRGLQTLALPAPDPKKKITWLPRSTAVHKIEEGLPTRLLTPFQADNDYYVKDTYNYVTVQTDVRMPKLHMEVLRDDPRIAAFAQAIARAIDACHAEDMDPRLLMLQGGAGLLAMEALRHGAHHVTVSERWLYLASVCKENLLANGFADDRVRVVYKRPSDLVLKKDLPVFANILVADVLDDALLTSGIIPGMRHALHNLLTPEAFVIPASATVYVQAVEIQTVEVCGLDVSAVNRHRWAPAFRCGTPLQDGAYTALCEPQVAWHFDFKVPPEEADRRTLDLCFTAPGIFNAVLVWYELRLDEHTTLNTGPAQYGGSGCATLRPALQYLAGEIVVDDGMVLPLVCEHNTVRLRFDVEAAEYINLANPCANFPPIQFTMLSDTLKYEAYYRAIERAVERTKAKNPFGECHVADLGTGVGAYAMMAAKSGATSVTGIEYHDAVADVARRNVAANGLGSTVSIVQRDVGLCERGKHVRRQGCNMAILDIFDAGLIGHKALYMIEVARRNFLQPNPTVVPQAATLYAMGVEVITSKVRGFDMSAINKYRWDEQYDTLYIDDVPHRRLTKPKKVFEYFFDGARKGRSRENVLKLEVVKSGILNGVVMWYDLHLDDQESITTAPEGIGMGGYVINLDTQGEGGKEQAQQRNGADEEGAAASSAPLRPNPRVFLDVSVGGNKVGRVTAELFADRVPRTAENFRALCTGERGMGAQGSPLCFRGAPFHRVVKGFMAQGGDITCGDGTGGESIYGGCFEDERDRGGATPHDRPGMLSMANKGANTNSSQFFVTLAAAPWLDGKHTVFGRLLGDESADVMRAVEAVGTPGGTPAMDVVIEDCGQLDDEGGNKAADEGGEADPVTSAAAADVVESSSTRDVAKVPEPQAMEEEAQERPYRHSQGQALQYLERAVGVSKGKKVTLLAKRVEDRVTFSLREGVGVMVSKSPWKIVLGGGASTESPHYQRVHYCELLVRDFLMRLRGKRFPPIEKDMAMILAHCGNLYLEPRCLQDVYHDFCVTEMVFQNHWQEFSPGAMYGAVSSRPLYLA